MRQHVNPLSRFFQLPLALPQPEAMFSDISLPIHLDIGSARGKFLFQLASLNPNWNHLGLEIRQQLVISSERNRVEKGLENLKFCFCNANISLKNWLLLLSDDQLQRVSIQFPDPWFKRRHSKRRVLQPDLLLSLAKALKPGTELFIQSDIYEVVNSMVITIEESHYFYRRKIDTLMWLKDNPYNVFTEREMYAMKKELPIYRALYVRNSSKIIGG